MSQSDRGENDNAPNFYEREQFREADALFDAALDLDTSERVTFVSTATSNDPSLRERVLALLVAHERSAEFLERPVAPDALLLRLQSVVRDAYLVRRRIAAGGMASVYLADDVKHQRRVAIKVFVSDDTTNDSTQNAERFLSEIRVTARLQHPNLLPLFDSGASAGLSYYVMPFVNGETLRDRLQRESMLPVDEALRLVHAIAGAVQHAHAEGVAHRDLKPANILLRDGQPLIADFGIALALADKEERRRTRSGMLIGTAQYMSPEQATGEDTIDGRTDIYSLGAMLYEMLVGDPPHVASTTQGVLAKVRAETPTAVHLLRETIPLSVSLAVDRALAKRPADRFQSMREFDEALFAGRSAGVHSGSHTESHTDPNTDLRANAPLPNSLDTQSGIRAPKFAYTASAAGLLLLIAAGVFLTRNKRVEAPTTAGDAGTRFIVAPLADAAIGRSPSITPDGASLVYAGSAETGRRLFVRNVNELVARALPGTEGALNTFVSPDGKWIGYISADDKLQKVPLAGGTPTALAGVFRYSDAAWVGNSRLVVSSYGQQGLSWTTGHSDGLQQLTRLDTLRRESSHGRPFVLPDARTMLFLVSHDRSGPGPEPGELAAMALDTNAKEAQPFVRLGIQSLGAVGYVDGWLLYVASDGGGLMAVRFDVATRSVRGEPVQVLDQADGGIDVAAIASNGTLLYTRARDSNIPLLVDSAGTAKPLLHDVSGSFMSPRLSPDGKRIAMQVTTKRGNDIWVYDLATNTPVHVTSSGSAVGATWTPDGKEIVYFSTQGGTDAAWHAPTDGSTAPARLLASDGIFGLSVTADGRQLLFQRMIRGRWSVWQSDMVGDHTPRPVVSEPYDALMPSLSPNGRWLAYATNESGRYEIYVRPYPGPGAAVQLSHSGGTEPVWSHDGGRLYFRGDRRMYEANISDNGRLSATGIRVLF
ncbi:MAG: protein kinase, partial [Gemmatimonadaceae bacterium]